MEPTPDILVDNHLFLGRVEEQKRFRAALDELRIPRNQEDLPYIFLLYGLGGMGKTTLAKRFRDIATNEEPYTGDFQLLWIDWEEQAKLSAALQGGRENVSPEAVFDLIHAATVRKRWGRYFDAYQKVRKARAEADREVAKALAGGGDQDELGPLRALGATGVAKFMRLKLPIIGNTGEKFTKELTDLGIKVGTEQAAKLYAVAEKQLRARLNSKQYEIFLEPHEQLALALGEGLKRLANGKRLLVALDTYEIVDRADPWLRAVMKAAGPRVVWVISGRANLRDSRQFGAEYFRGYADEFPRRLVAVDMVQLAADDVRRYFADVAPERPLSDDELAALARATRGIPLAMRLAAEMWRGGTPVEAISGEIDDGTSRQEIVRLVTDRYLMHVVAESDQLALYALALANGDREQLRAMLQPDSDDGAGYDLNAHLRRLERDYSSVHLDTARLHDEPAYFLLERLRTEQYRQSEAIRALNERGAAALEARLARHERELPRCEERCDDEDWMVDAVWLAYRLFWIDEERGWRWLAPRYVEALAYSRELRRGLQQVLDDWQGPMTGRGRKRAKALGRLNQWYDWRFSNEDIVEGLETLEELERLGWLAGEGTEERRAILALVRGRVWLRAEQNERALAQFEAAERSLPEDGKRLREQLGEALDDLARKLLWPEGVTFAVTSPLAARILPKVVAWLPEKSGAWYRLGVACKQVGQLNEAIAAYQRAIELDPKDATPHNNLGNVYKVLKQYDDAIAAYQKAIELDPKDAFPHYGLGNIYSNLGRHDEALTAYQHAIELDPKFALPHMGLAAVYRKLGDDTAFQHHLALARPLMSKEDDYNRACFASIAGDVDEALALLTVAISKTPGDRLLAQHDPDFDFICDDPRFQELVSDDATMKSAS